MSAEDQGRADVHRLLDILVEEVSLVDHAANKHRFLIVKRNNDMSDSNDNNGQDDPILDLAEEDDEAEQDLDASRDDDTSDDNAASRTAALSLAAEALEGLTETVELLGTASNDNTMPRLTELATGLRDVSEKLVVMAGAANDNADEAKNTPASGKDSLADTLGAARATLQQVSDLLRAQATPTKPNPADDKSTLGRQLDTLTNELKTLTTTVKEQQQRIARLEKRAGLPNSKPVGEKARTVAKHDQGDDDDGWPMDMNRSLDRESVDKSVSFHDI